VEYNPRCDISDLTAIVAAKLVKEIGGMMVKTAPGQQRSDDHSAPTA